VLVLDEATSSLDADSEEIYYRLLQQIQVSGKTLIILAHRLNTIRIADTIICIRDGRVRESGNHDELLARKGYYYNLWRKQQYP